MWMWVEPLHHPFAAMSVIRGSRSVSSLTSPAAISTLAVTGSYSKPRTASISSEPTGNSIRKLPAWWKECSPAPPIRA